MKLYVFRLFVTCYLTCILCKNVVGESTLAKVFSPINNAFQSNGRISEIDNKRTEQSIKTETRPDGIALKRKDDWPKPKTPRSLFVQDLSIKMRILNDFEKTNCSRYCIKQLEGEIGKRFEDKKINLVWSFADQNENDFHFSLENSSNFLKINKILKHLSIDNKNSTILDFCEIYLNLNCDKIVNMGKNLIIQNDEFYSSSKFFRQNVKIFKNYSSIIIPDLSKKLMHKINLSGYTETNFETDANVTGIVINILGNLTRAVLAIPTRESTLTDGVIQKPGIVMSLTSTHNPKGVAIGARNLPGRWCVKLTGVENSKYNFDVIAYYGANKENNTRDDISDINSTSKINRKNNFDEILSEKHITQSKAPTILIKETRENIANNNVNSLLIESAINEKRKFVFERSAEIMDPYTRRNNDEIMTDNFSDISLSSHESTATIFDKNISLNHLSLSLSNNSLISYGQFKILPNASSTKEQQQKIQARSSEVASLNEDIDAKMKSPISETISMQMDSDQSQTFSTQFNVDSFEKRKILLDVNANSKLIAAPGTTHRVIFDATNNCVLPVRYVIQARSSPFRIINVQPTYIFLDSGQTNQIAVDIYVPPGSQETVNILTLLILGKPEISKKTVHIFVQNAFSKNIDNVKPTIEYSFNSNCAGKLDKDRCDKTFWSADITVQDYDSGNKLCNKLELTKIRQTNFKDELSTSKHEKKFTSTYIRKQSLKRVIAIPNGIYSLNEYISGTKDRVTFYYLSTCCTTTATITAIDISENQSTRTIDVTTWDNLSQGEIAAIVLGALFLLFLLVLLIVAIIYCVRKRSSHDLSYTQRYSSRQPARSERTSF